MTPKETFRKLIEYYHFPVGNDQLTKTVIEEMKKEVYRALGELEALEEALEKELVNEECLWNEARADGKGETARKHKYCGETLARILKGGSYD